MKYFNHLCANCGIWLEPIDSDECSACQWLAKVRDNPHPSWDRELKELARQGYTNRRWQMRFNRGEL
jgi:hypothetical protein